MVEPMSDEDRLSGMMKLRLAVVALVGASALLIGIQGGATPLQLAVITLAGLGVGGLLTWYVFPERGSVDDRRRSYRGKR